MKDIYYNISRNTFIQHVYNIVLGEQIHFFVKQLLNSSPSKWLLRCIY